MHPLFHWKVGHHRLLRRERFVGYLPFGRALTTNREFADVATHVNLKRPAKAGCVQSIAASDTVVAKSQIRAGYRRVVPLCDKRQDVS
jgi:hypothetical protein